MKKGGKIDVAKPHNNFYSFYFQGSFCWFLAVKTGSNKKLFHNYHYPSQTLTPPRFPPFLPFLFSPPPDKRLQAGGEPLTQTKTNPKTFQIPTHQPITNPRPKNKSPKKNE